MSAPGRRCYAGAAMSAKYPRSFHLPWSPGGTSDDKRMADVSGLLGRVRTPTLVIHSRDDAVVPISEGRLLAAEIPGAQFVELDSKNHVLLEHEPAWGRFCEAVLEFVGLGSEAAGKEDPAFASL